MLSHEDLQKLNGMKFITYKDAERNQEWKFMVRASQALLEENRQLKEQIANLRKDADAGNSSSGKGKDSDW